MRYSSTVIRGLSSGVYSVSVFIIKGIKWISFQKMCHKTNKDIHLRRKFWYTMNACNAVRCLRAYCIEGVNLEQYQVGVIGSRGSIKISSTIALDLGYSI